MRRCFWILGLVACADPSSSPPRDRDVLVEDVSGGTVIYQDGDGPWQIAPPAGDRFGFDVAAERYAVAVVDPVRRRVDALQTTVAEDSDVKWFTTERFDVPHHKIHGVVTGVGENGGVITSPVESLVVREGEPFELEAVEGSNTIVVERIELVTAFSVASLIVLRDVPVVADLVIDADLATTGVSTLTTQIAVSTGTRCPQRTIFSFGDTSFQTGSTIGLVTFPNQVQWQATDHLTVELDCEMVGRFSHLTIDAATPSSIPTRLEAPPDFGFGEVRTREDRLELRWLFYPKHVEFYEGMVTTAGCPQCARWTTRITEGWVGLGTSEAFIVSPLDLELLGLGDPRLALPADPAYEVSAIVFEEQSRSVAGIRGRAGELP